MSAAIDTYLPVRALEQYPSADFADCLLVARATHLGRDRFLSFDAGAARLPRVELLKS